MGSSHFPRTDRRTATRTALRWVAVLVLGIAPIGDLPAASSVPDGAVEVRTTAPGTLVFDWIPPAADVVPSADGTGAAVLAGDLPVRPSADGRFELPVRTVRVAVPPGVVPTLEVEAIGVRVLPGVVPRPPARRVWDVPPAGDERDPTGYRDDVRSTTLRPRPEARSANAAPEPWARVGETGRFRHQDYVEVVLRPVVHDPTAGATRVAGRLRVRMAWDAAGEDTGAVRPDPELEDAYRSMLVNYGQGTAFRRPEPPPSATLSAASTDDPNARRRIRIRATGPTVLDHAALSGTGFPAEPISSWKLTSQGAEVPIRVVDPGGNDLLDPGDRIEFWGEALDDEPDTRLNTDLPAGSDIYEATDWSDENVYFLTVEPGTRARMAEVDGTPTDTSRTPPDRFEDVSRVEQDTTFSPLGGGDPWVWSPFLNSGGSTTRTEDVPLPGVVAGSTFARVVAGVRGTTESSSVDPDHATRVTLLDASNQSLETDERTFDGRSDFIHDFPWDGLGGSLTDPVRVRLEARPIASGTHTVVLDRIEVHYERAFVAVGDRLEFSWANEAAELRIEGFSGPDVEIWERTDAIPETTLVAPRRITGAEVTADGSSFTARFWIEQDPAYPAGAMRRFVAFAPPAASTPSGADFEADAVSDLRDPGKQADVLVIGHPDLIDLSLGSALDRWIALRNSQGLSVEVARLDDVEDEFGHGLHGPDAIREFVRYVLSSEPGEGWSDPRPAYLLLLGDGSFDFKAGTAKGNWVPTSILLLDRPELGYYASDNRLADGQGDDELADLVVGRVPGRSLAAIERMLDKFSDYEELPPPGNWSRHAVLISDRGKQCATGEALDFETTADAAESFLKRPPHTSRNLKYYADYCTADCICDVQGMRQDIKDAVNGLDGFSDGAGIVQFSGHGNFEVWSDDAFFDERNPPPRDTDDLVNGGRLPWMMAHNCLTGGFHVARDDASEHSMGEDWLRRDGGGSVAVFSPSGLSFNYVGRRVSDRVWEDVFGRYKERTLAVPVMNTLAMLCPDDVESCQHYTLLGDPTLNLAFPSVAPPTGVAATPGNRRVDLTWTASTTPGATYDVYRTTDPVRVAYTRVNGGPVAGTSFADTGVTNAVTYYYYLLALDAEGFESRWSHFNSDCDGAALDCLSVTPLNPDPPAPPTGVEVVDPEVGFSLDVSWNASPESDLDFYTVHWGTEPGVYTDSLGTGRSTATRIGGLENGVTYHVAVTATNTSDRTSDPSVEVTGVPTWIRGVRAPGFVSDLTVDKSGTDAVLSWSAVVEDIYGKDETVARYEVHRGPTPDFEPSPTTLLDDQVTGTTYTDVGALGGGTPDYHYLVRAVDVDGNVGGLGRQLPAGVDALAVDKSETEPGRLVLSWPAVTATFDGGPTTIVRYDVYGSDQPFDRAAVRDGLVGPPVSVTGTSWTVDAPAGDRYWSVIAVDDRGNESPY